MRLFIEAALEPSALDQVWSAGQRMQAEPSFPVDAVRWVRREALHLTLRFLGEVEEAQAEHAAHALRELDGCGPFELRLGEVGSFGGRRLRVVWVGLTPD